MLSKTSHKQNIIKILTNTLTDIQKLSGSPILLTDQKTYIIIERLLSSSDLFSIGIMKVFQISKQYQNHSQDNIIVIGRFCQQFIEKYTQFLTGKKLYFINTNLTISEQNIKLLKQWKLRKSIKALKQINLDFVPFLDRSFYLNSKGYSQFQRINSLTSLLTTFEKFYEFQIIYPKNQKWQKGTFIPNLIKNLQEKLKILQNYKVQQYKQCNQKTKLLILDRQNDLTSPLVTSLNYGPMIYQMKQQKNLQIYLPKGGSRILNQVFDLDFQEIKLALDRIIQQKIQYRKMDLELSSFDKAKQIIIKNYDPNTKHQQIQIHLLAIKVVMQYCLKRGQRFILQQNIVNGINQVGIQMSSGNITKQIDKWIKQQKSIDVQTQYLKIATLAFMVYDFWFFNKNQILAAFPKQFKKKFKPFLQKLKGNYPKLIQKKQNPENRFDYYRHQPKIIRSFINWFKSQPNNNQNFESKFINKTQRNGQSKYIIYINGPLGYNQLSYLRNLLNGKQQNARNQKKQINIENPQRYMICCDQLMTTYEYLQWFMQKIEKGSQLNKQQKQKQK